jgi:hypothetical protein
VNIKTRFEFFDGYGFTELVPTLASALVSGLFAFAVHAASGGVTGPALIVLVGIAVSVTGLVKGETGMSVIDQIGCLLRFARGQRKYPYRFTDEWSDET